MDSHHTAALNKIFKRTSADRPNKFFWGQDDFAIQVILLASMLKGHPNTVKKMETKTFSTMKTVADNSFNISQGKSNKVASKVGLCPMCNENHDNEDCTCYLQTMLWMSGNSDEGT